MSVAANLAVILIVLLHVYFMVLEMFFWDKPYGMRVFNLKPDFAKESKALAANQGLYNGFLVAGLLWGLTSGVMGHDILIFFLLCVIVAGIFGALTANRRILFVQAIPGAIALVLVTMR